MKSSNAYTLTKETLYVECCNCGHTNVFEDDTETYSDVFGRNSKATFNCSKCGCINNIEYLSVRII